MVGLATWIELIFGVKIDLILGVNILGVKIVSTMVGLATWIELIFGVKIDVILGVKIVGVSIAGVLLATVPIFGVKIAGWLILGVNMPLVGSGGASTDGLYSSPAAIGKFA